MSASRISMTEPVIVNPLASILAFPKDIQNNLQCRDMELNYAKCLEAYGFHKGYTECKAYYNDLLECVYCGKQLSRSEIIDGEYKRQQAAGEKREYLKPPFFAHI